MTQKQKVLKYIERFDSISPIEAFSRLGITKLATVVSTLKKEGWTFEQHYEDGTNRFGERVRYMRYSNARRTEHD